MIYEWLDDIGLENSSLTLISVKSANHNVTGCNQHGCSCIKWGIEPDSRLATSLGLNLHPNDCLHSLSKQFVTWKCCAGQIGFEGLRKSKASGWSCVYELQVWPQSICFGNFSQSWIKDLKALAVSSTLQVRNRPVWQTHSWGQANKTVYVSPVCWPKNTLSTAMQSNFSSYVKVKPL